MSQVSDREALAYVHSGTPVLVKQAQAMVAAGKGEEILTRSWDGSGSTPITARRYVSLAAVGGDDDIFSSDLSDTQLKVSPLSLLWQAAVQRLNHLVSLNIHCTL